MSALKECVILNLIMPLAERLMGTCAMRWRKQILEMNTWSAEKIRAWQNEKLHAFVTHAYEHTAYYKRQFDTLGIKPEDIQTIEDLQKLPIIRKQDVIEHFEELKADNAYLFKHRLCHTGGSTGEPMYHLFDEDSWGYDTAAKIIAWKKTGYHYGDSFVALGSASLFEKKAGMVRRVYDGIRGEIALNCLNLNDDLCEKYVKIFRKKRIRYVYGYAAALYTFALYCKRNRVDLTQIQAAFSTSENLTQLYRKTIEETWKCQVMDCWGCRDAGLATFEVKRGYYFVGYNSILESIDRMDDGMGTMLSTNILNYSMPLLRYEFGDVARLVNSEEARAETGYNGQLVTGVMGRISDMIHLRNGHILTAPGFTILMLNFDVIAYDIRPLNGNEGIVMRIQRGGGYDEVQELMLKKELERLCGEGAVVRIEYVDCFEQSKNGKHRFFINEN